MSTILHQIFIFSFQDKLYLFINKFMFLLNSGTLSSIIFLFDNFIPYVYGYPTDMQ